MDFRWQRLGKVRIYKKAITEISCWEIDHLEYPPFFWERLEIWQQLTFDTSTIWQLRPLDNNKTWHSILASKFCWEIGNLTQKPYWQKHLIDKDTIWQLHHVAICCNRWPSPPVWLPHRIIDDRMEKYQVWILIRLHLKVLLLRRIEESSSRWKGRVSSRQQIV